MCASITQPAPLVSYIEERQQGFSYIMMYLFTSPASAYCVDIDANANLLLYFNNKTILLLAIELFKYATHVQYTALRRTAINTHSYAIYVIFRISVDFFFFLVNDLSLVNRWFFYLSAQKPLKCHRKNSFKRHFHI